MKKLIDRLKNFDFFDYNDFADLPLNDLNLNDIINPVINNYIEKQEREIKGKENMNNEDLLEKVTDAATFLYVKNLGDSVAPNVLFSKLPNKQYYVALNRYNIVGRYDKNIVFKSTKTSLNEALLDVARFLSTQKIEKKNPLEELGKLFEADEVDDVRRIDYSKFAKYPSEF